MKGDCVEPASLTEQLLVGETALSVMVATDTLHPDPHLWCAAMRCMVGDGSSQSRGRWQASLLDAHIHRK